MEVGRGGWRLRMGSRVVRRGLIAVLAVCVAAAVWTTRGWPLAGDAALMHYVVFLLRGGAVPYRQVVDVNLPGAYLFEAMGMRVFGAGAAGLRVYDWFLCGWVALGCVGLAGRRRWFAGLFAGLLFAVIHVQDGVAQQGQRDLLLAALLLGGMAALRILEDGTEHRLAASFLFGLMFGVSFTVKPVLAPLAVALLVLGCARSKALRSPVGLGAALAGLLLPCAVAFWWLHGQGAVGVFLGISRSLLPLHAALGRKPLLFLVNHSFSPLGVPLLGGVALVWLGQARLAGHRGLFGVAVAGALLAYVVQGKGYPYQRYPLLVVLLVGLGLMLENALEAGVAARAIALGMVVWTAGAGAFFTWRSSRFETRSPTVEALSAQLLRYGTPGELDGTVQCLDTFTGCVNTLYALGVRQSTGFLYDCYLFTDASAVRDAYREQFRAEFERTRPRLVVLSSQNCFKTTTEGYDRLASWPAFAAELGEQYRVAGEWRPTEAVAWSSRRQMPAGFRLLVRKDP